MVIYLDGVGIRENYAIEENVQINIIVQFSFL